MSELIGYSELKDVKAVGALRRVCIGLFGASAKAIICNNGLFGTLKVFFSIIKKIGICVYYFHK